MSAAPVTADTMRARRQAFAAPGGFHDRLVRMLGIALPAAVGVVVATMVVTPLFPRGDVSFLLDRNKVAVTDQRLRVDQATYRGQDNKGRTFTVSAGSAIQHSAAEPVVALRDLTARLQFDDGAALVVAPTARYDIRSDMMKVDGPVDFRRADGYHMVTSGLAIDLKHRSATGAGGVSGTVPTGSFRADRVSADLAARTVVLDGGAHLHMEQHGLHLR